MRKARCTVLAAESLLDSNTQDFAQLPGKPDHGNDVESRLWSGFERV